MVGILKLSNDLLCQKDVLGKILECEIGGTRALLHFPILNENVRDVGITNPLLPPLLCNSWIKDGKKLDWGNPMRYPEWYSCVKTLAVSVECDKDSTNEIAQKMYKSIEEWEYSFWAYLKLVTKQGIYRDRNVGQNYCSLQLFDGKYISNHTPIQISLNIPLPTTFASSEEIVDAIAFANSGKDLLLEYLMLLSAYAAILQNQNRRAIMDACSALEIVLLKQIDIHSKANKQMPEIAILDRMSLGDRIKLLREIDSNFPVKDYDNLIVKQRNDLMHGRVIFPSDETTNTLISCVEDVLKYYHTEYY